MLEKAKNRKIFYFFILIVLGVSLFFSPVSADWFNATPSNAGWLGYYNSAGVLWETAHDAATGTHVYQPYKVHTKIFVDNEIGKVQELTRGFLVFDTAAIPDDIHIKNVSLSLMMYQNDEVSGLDKYVDLVYFFPVTPTSITTGDYDRFGTNVYDSVEMTGLVRYDRVNFDIIDDGIINKTGYTTIGLRLRNDVTDTYINTTDVGQSLEVYWYGTTDAGSYKPILYIEYDTQNADIDVSPSSGASPLAVQFTDKSTGFTEGVDTIYLNYGDGNSYSGTYPGYDASRNYIYLNAGTYNYTYKVTSSGSDYYSNGTVTVTGDSTVNFQVIVRGLNGAYIGDATVNIWYDSGTMIDSDITDDFYGSADFYVNPSRYVNGNVTKDGYYTSNFTHYVCPTGYCSNEVWITLYTTNETPGSGDEFGNYLVTFKDAVTGEEVGYSNIEVYSDSGYTTLFYDEYSNALGVWTGLIPMDVIYYYKYPETTSYYSQSWSYNLTSSPSYKTVNLIPKSGATSTPTPTPTITTTTITPTVTYTYNDSNLSTLNVKERFTNLLVLAGFQNAESADLIFAMIIVLGCTALIGWITLSGSGAGMGAIIGFVFSLGLGLIPLWLLIAAIFFACLYVALKLFGGSGE